MLREKLQEDLKEAMRSRSRAALSVLRLALTALRNAEVERARPLTPGEELEVLAGEARKRREAAATYRSLGQEERARLEEEELAVLESYLPPPLEQEELARLVEEAIAATGASGPRDVGKVMGYLMPKLRGRVEGAVLADTVRKRLGA